MANKVSVIGSGNWGTTIARMVGTNCAEKSSLFEKKVNMWVFEEKIQVDGKEYKLTEYINQHHENVKYLPGTKLPDNVVAVPDVKDAIAGSNILIFVLPHQFVKGTCESIKDLVRKDAFAISLCKGFEVTENDLIMISDVVKNTLNISCGALMGANLANEIAMEQFAEATIATKDESQGRIFQQVFNRPFFRCAWVDDVTAVECCGALKNIIALGAGFVDALGMGNNTKCAIIRLGLMEMMAFAEEFYGCKNRSVFFESCGIADLVTTSYGGRHTKLGKLFVTTGKSFEELEKEHLNGQKLQGHQTAEKVYKMLEAKGPADVEKYPLFAAIHRVSQRQMKADQIFECLQNHPEHM
ncbi:glycerol-3-phosphate dehydrogenase [NAD(+)], cytoplasmic-like [Symsagittifera roscoffensis]|uniref:glycerol-3-phosphate dehydrogenase [NAD(+)], cytoplasmic-like n=1 Tax=Symsagittifera roscoffensis TaxID=84072 RepID=UPI00307B4462